MGSSQSKKVVCIEVKDDGTLKRKKSGLDNNNSYSSRRECDSSKRDPKSLSRFPGFLKALENDESNVITCYNTKGQVDYISAKWYDLLGYHPEAKLETLDHPMAPRQGAIYFRLHANGSVVQFHNIFWSKSESGEMFSIDQPLVDTTSTFTSTTLLINRNGDITSCDGYWQTSKLEKDGDIVGENLFQLCQTSHASCISNAVSRAAYGRRSFSLYTKFMTGTAGTDTSTCAQDVTIDFHPCVNGQVVVSVSLVHDNNIKDGNGAVICINKTSSKNDSDVDTIQSIEHSGGSSDIEPLHNHQVYCLGQRLREMSAEIQYLQDFRDNALLPMYSTIETGEIVWANNAMITLMGFEGQKDEFLGSNNFDYHVDKDNIRLMCERVMGGQTLHDFACMVKRRDGKILNVTYNSNAKFHSNGEFSHSRCIVQDMTERNKLRVERDKMEREKQLAEGNEKQALTASRTKSNFLAVMSHEIRTPINGVIGAASLLSTTALNDEQLDYVKTISDSADILLSLIHNILDISKIEKGKFQLDKVSMRFVDLVRKCTDMMKNQAMERGLSVVTTIGAELDDPDVWHHGDPTRLNQVLLNFLSNAVKFTHTGSVTCKLTKVTADYPSSNNGNNKGKYLIFVPLPSSDEDDSNSNSVTFTRRPSSTPDLIRLEVTDTGVGIADCSKLFSDFVQASSTVHQKYGGTGLGLSISKKIIHMMHGEVGMYSTVGVGTTVWAEIPMRRVSAPRKGPSFIPSPPRCPAITTALRCPSHKDGDNGSRRVRILIVEDNNVNQKVLKRLLETLGYTDIAVAWNGQEAVDAMKESWEKFLEDPSVGRYDIVLMDCLMPVMDGWEATSTIRANEQESMTKATALSADAHPTIVLALTANATEEDKQRCSDCGMDGFYVKPMSRDGLNAMMLHWVSKLFSDASSQDGTPRDY